MTTRDNGAQKKPWPSIHSPFGCVDKDNRVSESITLRDHRGNTGGSAGHMPQTLSVEKHKSRHLIAFRPTFRPEWALHPDAIDQGRQQPAKLPFVVAGETAHE